MKAIIARCRAKINPKINPIDIDPQNLPTVKEIFQLFDQSIGSEIKNKYDKLLKQDKLHFVNICTREIKSMKEIQLEKKQEIGNAMVSFVIGDDIHNPHRKKLLQDVIKTEIACAEGNAYLYYVDYLENTTQWTKYEIANIIKECFSKTPNKTIYP